jgi:long-subunit fatty acid transport protein
MKRIIKVSLIFIVLLNSAKIFAQVITEEGAQNDNFKHTFFTGGNLGLQFGSVTMVDISPQFGYYVLENMSVGAGLTYQYINDHRFSETMHVIGGRVFTRLYLPFYNSIFAHGEYEYMTYNTNVFSLNGQKEWINLSNVLAGVGYRQRIAGRSAITLMVLWNFNETPYTLYSNPIIRAGFDIGF